MQYDELRRYMRSASEYASQAAANHAKMAERLAKAAETIQAPPEEQEEAEAEQEADAGLPNNLDKFNPREGSRVVVFTKDGSRGDLIITIKEALRAQGKREGVAFYSAASGRKLA